MNSEYPLVIAPLSEEDGGGFIAIFPDLQGCFSDGETQEEAVANAKDAIRCWMEVQKERGVEIPDAGRSALHVQNKIAALFDALKTLIEYSEHADDRIESLERKLSDLKTRLQSDWRETDVFIAHVSAAKHRAGGKASLNKFPRDTPAS